MNALADILLRLVAFIIASLTFWVLYLCWSAATAVMQTGQNMVWLQSLSIDAQNAKQGVIIGRDDLLQNGARNGDLAERRHMAIKYDPSRGWLIANIARQRNLELTYSAAPQTDSKPALGSIFARRWQVLAGDIIRIPLPLHIGADGRKVAAETAELRILDKEDWGLRFSLRFAERSKTYRLLFRPYDGAHLSTENTQQGDISSVCERRSSLAQLMDMIKSRLKSTRAALQSSKFGALAQNLTQGQQSEDVLLSLGGSISCADPYDVPRLGLPGLPRDTLRFTFKAGIVFFAPGKGAPIQAARVLMARQNAPVPQRFSSISWPLIDEKFGILTELVAGRTAYKVTQKETQDGPQLNLIAVRRVSWQPATIKNGRIVSDLPQISMPDRVKRLIVSRHNKPFSGNASRAIETAFPMTGLRHVWQQKNLGKLAGLGAALGFIACLFALLIHRFLLALSQGRNFSLFPSITGSTPSRRFHTRHTRLFAAGARGILVICIAAGMLAVILVVPAAHPATSSYIFSLPLPLPWGLSNLALSPIGYDIHIAGVLTLWGLASLFVLAEAVKLKGRNAVLMASFWLLLTLIAMIGLVTLAHLGLASDSTRWLVFLDRRIKALAVLAFIILVALAISAQSWRRLLIPLFLDPNVPVRSSDETNWLKRRRAYVEALSNPELKTIVKGTLAHIKALFLGAKPVSLPLGGTGTVSWPPLPPLRRFVRHPLPQGPRIAIFVILILLAPLAILFRMVLKFGEILLMPLLLLLRFAGRLNQRLQNTRGRGAAISHYHPPAAAQASHLIREGGTQKIPAKRKLLRWIVRLYRLSPFIVLAALFIIWLAAGGETGIGSLQPSEAAKFGLLAIAGAALVYIDRARYEPDALMRYWYPVSVIGLMVVFFGAMLLVPALKSDMSPILIIVTSIFVSLSLFFLGLELTAAFNQYTLKSPRNTFTQIAWRQDSKNMPLAAHLVLMVQRFASMCVIERRFRHLAIWLMRHAVLIFLMAFVASLAGLIVYFDIPQLFTSKSAAEAKYHEAVKSYLGTPLKRLLSWHDLEMPPPTESRETVIIYPDLGEQVKKSRTVITHALCPEGGQRLSQPLRQVVPALPMPFTLPGIKVTTTSRIVCPKNASTFDTPDRNANGTPPRNSSHLWQLAPEILRVPAIQDDFIGAFVLSRFGPEGGALLIGLQVLLIGVMIAGAVSVMRFSQGNMTDRLTRQFLSFCMLGGALLLLLHWGISWGNTFGVLPVMGQPMTLVSAGESHTLFMALPLILTTLIGFRLGSVNDERLL